MSKLELTDKHGKVYLVEERCVEEREKVFNEILYDIRLNQQKAGEKYISVEVVEPVGGKSGTMGDFSARELKLLAKHFTRAANFLDANS